MLAAMDAVLDEHQPDWVLVYGDTNSTVAAALAAVKMHLPLAHVEAGLRSFNRRMPEEHNRVLTDHAADLLLPPTELAFANLAREGLAHRAVVTGDVMTDVCFRTRDEVLAKQPALPVAVPIDGPFLVATVHRAENTDEPERLRAVVDALTRLPVPVLLLAHPRLVSRAATYDIALSSGALRQLEPLAYREMVALVLRSAGVVTDSGGLQKEAFLLERPCTTLRTETEWAETLEGGWNVLDPDLTLLPDCAVRDRPSTTQATPYGDGAAAKRTVEVLRDRLSPDVS
jgi:UDP-N-acetylglucosamine 2-epimerase (non-hydrolysing)